LGRSFDDDPVMRKKKGRDGFSTLKAGRKIDG